MATVPVPAGRPPFPAPAARPVLQARILTRSPMAGTQETAQGPSAAQCAPGSGQSPRKRPGAWCVEWGRGRAPGQRPRKNKPFVPTVPREHMIATHPGAGPWPEAPRAVLGGISIKTRTLGVGQGAHVTRLVDAAFH